MCMHGLSSFIAVLLTDNMYEGLPTWVLAKNSTGKQMNVLYSMTET